jgi:hypothetical protein
VANKRTDARKVAHQRALALGNPVRGSRDGSPRSQTLKSGVKLAMRGLRQEADAFRGNATSYLGL